MVGVNNIFCCRKLTIIVGYLQVAILRINNNHLITYLWCGVSGDGCFRCCCVPAVFSRCSNCPFCFSVRFWPLCVAVFSCICVAVQMPLDKKGADSFRRLCVVFFGWVFSCFPLLFCGFCWCSLGCSIVMMLSRLALLVPGKSHDGSLSQFPLSWTDLAVFLSLLMLWLGI